MSDTVKLVLAFLGLLVVAVLFAVPMLFNSSTPLQSSEVGDPLTVRSPGSEPVAGEQTSQQLLEERKKLEQEIERLEYEKSLAQAYPASSPEDHNWESRKWQARQLALNKQIQIANDTLANIEEKRIETRVGEEIDKLVAQMDSGNVAFNTPGKMKLDSPAAIELVLSPSHSVDELKSSITAEGPKEGAQIRISEVMEARLTGTAFQIGAITPEQQAVSARDVTAWKWEVRPTQYGHHNLHLTLSAVITVKDSSKPRTIRTFDRTIEVEVSSWRWLFITFRENWEWMWTLVALPILGVWWGRRRVQASKLDAGSTPTTRPAKRDSRTAHAKKFAKRKRK